MPGIGFFAWSIYWRTSKIWLYLKIIVRLSISPEFSPKQQQQQKILNSSNTEQKIKRKNNKHHSVSNSNLLIGQITLALKKNPIEFLNRFIILNSVLH